MNHALFKVGGPMPAAIGMRADLYHDVRELRLLMEKEVKEIRARETELKDSIINELPKSGNTGAAGQRYRAQIITKEKYNIADWGVLCSWIRKNDRFDMLQRRLGEGAVKEFTDAEGRVVPGTEKVLIPDVSITKIG